MKWFRNTRALEEVRAEHNQTLHSVIALKNVEIEGLRSQLAEARKERDFYREALFQLKGIGAQPAQENAKTEKELKPLKQTREPWPMRQRRLEREDRERLAEAQKLAAAQVQATQDHWDKKNKEVQEKEDAIQ